MTSGANRAGRQQHAGGHWDWPVHLPYRHGVKAAGEMIFLGGQVAMDPDGNVLHKFDLAAQTRVALDNIVAVLDEFGASMQDVVKINRWYVAGGTREEWETAATIMASFFTEPGPAASGIPVPALAYEGLMVEIEVIAMAGQ
jgi:enamine deaminase RidA (YjgF/YER057c/UK114 family)